MSNQVSCAAKLQNCPMQPLSRSSSSSRSFPWHSSASHPCPEQHSRNPDLRLVLLFIMLLESPQGLKTTEVRQIPATKQPSQFPLLFAYATSDRFPEPNKSTVQAPFISFCKQLFYISCVNNNKLCMQITFPISGGICWCLARSRSPRKQEVGQPGSQAVSREMVFLAHGKGINELIRGV